MRIRSRLLLLILAVFIPAFLAAAMGVVYVYSGEQQAYRQSMRSTTRALALVVDKEIAMREGILRTLAASPALDQKDFEAFYKQARGVAIAWDTTIILSDISGQQFLNTRRPYGTTDLPKSLNNDLRMRYGPEATVISNLYYAPIGKNFSFSVQIPVKRGDRILYYISMGTFVSKLQSVFKDQQLPGEWIGTILDRNGTTVARSVDAEKYIGKQVTQSYMQKLAANAEGFHEGTSFNGVPVGSFFSRAPSSGWIFLVNVPQSEIRRTAVGATAYMSGILVFLLGAAILGALAMERHAAVPIDALRLSAEKLGRGENVAAQSFGVTEMDAVSIALAHAGDEIQRAKTDLEHRVSAAVAAAEQSQRALLQGQKLEALGRLTGGIAHDFNNVLQTLTTGLQLAERGSVDPRVKFSLEACQRAVKRAGELTRQLMAFGRVQDARLETIDLREQMTTMEPMLKACLPSDIHLDIRVADALWPVTLDPLQCELALLNLTLNARDAMQGAGALQVEVHNETVLQQQISDLVSGDYVRISIKDSGAGMSQDVLNKALDPFFTTKSVGSGSGMGLPQAYGFAKQSGGTLILQSKPGEGTVVTVYLPKAAEPAGIPETGKNVANRSAVAGGRVLFVEDDPLVRDVVLPALETSGFEVVAAKDGAAALALLDSDDNFDLIFSDIVMPGNISGIDLAEIVQRRFPSIRVILATGYSDRRVPLSGVRTLAKPYTIAQILDALNDVHETPDQGAGPENA